MTDFKKNDPIVAFENVCKNFHDTPILDHVSMEIDTSHILGLAGPSGGGKSTFLRLIQRLEQPDTGLIHCKAATGFMFQNFCLFPHMTVWDNITYAPKIHKKEGYEKRAHALLKKLGITAYTHHYPGTLSGGQKQRVALARSLIMEPDILLCDEPTSGLDIATTKDVVRLLEDVQKLGVTMIIASHDLDFLTEVSHRIILLKNGKIAIDMDPKKEHNPIEMLKRFY